MTLENKSILVYDIECATNGAGVSEIEKHKLKYFGGYSYKYDTFYFFTDKKQIQTVLSAHKILVGFNNIQYDNVILRQEFYNINYKYIIDLYQVVKKRAGLIPFEKLFLLHALKSFSLKNIVETLKLDADGTKLDIDYHIFDNEHPTIEQLAEIKKYTDRDIMITKKLFEWLHEKFYSWKHHLNDRDKAALKYLSCATSVYAYKVLANRVGFDETYAKIEKKEYQGIGGYVAYPAIEKLEKNIYCLDFASLYPHIMIQCNLYGRNKNGKGWNGNGKFKMNGFYDDKEMNPVAKVLLDIYNERQVLKSKKDTREHGLKIVLNTCYGLLRNPVFEQIYDNVAGEDCCIIGQQWIKLARQRFKEAGYFVFYTDTDSIYLQDVYDDKEKMLGIKDSILKEIKDNVPFPQPTFDMGIDYEIDMIHFFKGGFEKDDSVLGEDDIKNKKLGLMKKNYLFVYNQDGKKTLFIKNLGIVKRTNTPLSKKIFWEKMVPIILESFDCKFDSSVIKKWVTDLLQINKSLIYKRISVQSKTHYKNETSIQIQTYNYIPKDKTEVLGEGIHYLVPNTKFGIGKGAIKYCTIDEFDAFLTFDDLYTEGVMRELRYFNFQHDEKITKRQNKKEVNIDVK